MIRIKDLFFGEHKWHTIGNKVVDFWLLCFNKFPRGESVSFDRSIHCFVHTGTDCNFRKPLDSQQHNCIF